MASRTFVLRFWWCASVATLVLGLGCKGRLIVPEPEKPPSSDLCSKMTECTLGQVCDTALGRCIPSDGPCSPSLPTGHCRKGLMCACGGYCMPETATCVNTGGTGGTGGTWCGCDATQGCVDGACVAVTASNGCSDAKPDGTCLNSETCVGGDCMPITVDNRCSASQKKGFCGPGLTCVEGICEPTSANPCGADGAGNCPDGQACEAGGTCVNVPCSTTQPGTCPGSDVGCAKDTCAPLPCRADHVQGACVQDVPFKTKFCSGGTCIVEGDCLVGADCDRVANTYCSLSINKCLNYLSSFCAAEADCTATRPAGNFGQGYTCVKTQPTDQLGTCQEKLTCTTAGSTTECKPPKFCSTALSCLSPGQCDDVADCNTAGGERCSLKVENGHRVCTTDECLVKEDCQDIAEFCSDSSHTCMSAGECNPDPGGGHSSDCPLGYDCIASKCEGPAVDQCTSNDLVTAGCTNTISCCGSGTCCADGKVCSSATAVYPKRVCLDSGNCISDADCNGALGTSAFVCLGFKCLPAPEQACDPFVCGGPGTSCLDCAVDEYCSIAGACIKNDTCVDADRDCRSGETCLPTGKCAPDEGCGFDRGTALNFVQPNMLIVLDRSGSMNLCQGAADRSTATCGGYITSSGAGCGVCQDDGTTPCSATTPCTSGAACKYEHDACDDFKCLPSYVCSADDNANCNAGQLCGAPADCLGCAPVGACACDTDLTCQAGCLCDPDCQCTCDTDATCQAGCDCDRNCVCSCDLTVGTCDIGCDCDAECPCSCDENAGKCDVGCFCDPDCTCKCNVTAGTCDASCVCDPDCACACDATGGVCDVGCTCDQDCLCTCDTDPFVNANTAPGSCQFGCVCDPQCACACDTDKFCQQSCPCDKECPTCSCNVSSGCDLSCECDPDCRCDPSKCAPSLWDSTCGNTRWEQATAAIKKLTVDYAGKIAFGLMVSPEPCSPLFPKLPQCSVDADCTKNAAGSFCSIVMTTPAVIGYCTRPCNTDSDCPRPSEMACKTDNGKKYCVMKPRRCAMDCNTSTCITACDNNGNSAPDTAEAALAPANQAATKPTVPVNKDSGPTIVSQLGTGIVQGTIFPGGGTPTAPSLRNLVTDLNGAGLASTDTENVLLLVTDGEARDDTTATAVCEPPCGNGLKDDNETDVDCGGNCPLCPDAAACARNSDCQSKICRFGECRSLSCADGIKNGTETDGDCGGICGPCADNLACGADDANCISNFCRSGACAPGECSDTRKNGEETDLDCGGPSCSKCADGQACAKDSDCSSNACAVGICRKAECNNTAQDPGETDLNCGGPDCGPCADGSNCAIASDCESGDCNGTICVRPSCKNKVKDGDETDVDCGGSCAPCGGGRVCAAATDCASEQCRACPSQGHCLIQTTKSCVSDSKCTAVGDRCVDLPFACKVNSALDQLYAQDPALRTYVIGFAFAGVNTALNCHTIHGRTPRLDKCPFLTRENCGQKMCSTDHAPCVDSNDCAGLCAVDGTTVCHFDSDCPSGTCGTRDACVEAKLCADNGHTCATSADCNASVTCDSAGFCENNGAYCRVDGVQDGQNADCTSGECVAATACYYEANDQATLSTAFNEIITHVASCRFTLSDKPPSEYSIYVYFDQGGVLTRIERDYSHNGGWDYYKNSNQIEFFGTDCDNVLADVVSPIVIRGKTGGETACP